MILSLYALTTFAQTIEIKKINIHSGPDLGTFRQEFQQPIFIFFSQLQEEKVIDDVYTVKPNLGMNMSPFGKLNLLPERSMNCGPVICKDIELQRKLNKELSSDRLILITHPWGGASGITFEPKQSGLQPFFDNLGSDKDDSKSIMAFAPDLSMDVLHHELNHAHDYKDPQVQEKISEIRDIMKTKDLKGYKTVESYIYEMRAYNSQTKYLKNNLREEEFYFDDEKMVTLKKPGKDYAEDIIRVNEHKKRMYQDRLNSALKSKALTDEEITRVKEVIEEALSLPLLN